MKKRTYAIIGMHALIVAGLSYGYACMCEKIKKEKQKNLDN